MTKTQLKNIDPVSGNLLQDLREIILKGRAMAYAAAGAVLLDTYWNLGKRIVESRSFFIVITRSSSVKWFQMRSMPRRK